MPLIFAEIDTPLTFTRFQSLDTDASKSGYYPGVLVIQKGPAKGHFAVKDGTRVVGYNPSNPDHAGLQLYQIMISDETLDDVVRCAGEGSIKCKLDHGSTVRDIVGDYSVFRRDFEQVRAGLTLMNSTPHRAYVEELFKNFSTKIGNSIDFDHKYEISGDVAIARCLKLNSVDLVDAPAATKSLFNQNNSLTTHMPLDKADLDAIGGLIDTKLSAHKTEFTSQLSALSKKFEEGEETDEEKAKKKKDEEKEEMSAVKMSEVVEKATLAAVEKLFPKAQREQFAKLDTEPHGESEMASLVKTYLAQGAGSKGIALQRISRDHPAKYNKFMKDGGTL